MATNNFKPFAIGAGANVVSQTDYEAAAALLAGFQSGKASSAQINKAIRQSSVMAYVLAQFISDSASVDVLDNGTPATILSDLKAGIKNSTTGRLLGPPQIFTASGAYTPTPGTKNVVVEVLGAGGGGGGAGSTGSSSYSSGSGGAAGGYAKSFLTSGFSGQPITVGTGGTAGNGSPSNGRAGGDSSFGSIIAKGGGGGLTQPPTTANYTQTGQSGGQATGGNLINTRGGSSGFTLRYDTVSFTGFGGNSMYGAGGAGFAYQNTKGFDGSGYGAGGGGAASFNSPSAYYAGGEGSGGVVIIWEYA